MKQSDAVWMGKTGSLSYKMQSSENTDGSEIVAADIKRFADVGDYISWICLHLERKESQSDMEKESF